MVRNVHKKRDPNWHDGYFYKFADIQNGQKLNNSGQNAAKILRRFLEGSKLLYKT